ncbi:protein kintoun [Cephus cinctus]|uniref:Protein kintoun n=1 Tax=Cephus cinctus TaxID=211228 RepID=A0AAJ7C9M8_CEPCN|nr:protein kintoun [Cephus cinctus]
MDVYDNRRKNWEDLDVTREEIESLTECLKKEEFRKLLIEYAEEVTDPDNRKIYEKEITQLEKERGVDVTFVNPEPGYVIKTSINGEKKCFVNISKSDTVAKPTSHPSQVEGHRGLQWSIPYTLVPPREDFDKKNVRCTVFDVVFHPDTLYLASKNEHFRDIVNSTALDGVENNFKVKLDRKNLKFPKMNFKGVTQPTVIRKPSEAPSKEPLDMEPEIYQKIMASYDENRDRQLNQEEKPRSRSPPPTTYFKKNVSNSENSNSSYTVPKFTIKHRSCIELNEFENHRNARMNCTIPQKLVIVIELPLLKSANDASLDVQERSLCLRSEKPAKYLLELPLPYRINAEGGEAKFDTKHKKLTIVLPVIRTVIPLRDSIEDSGVDTDNGSPPPCSNDNDRLNGSVSPSSQDRETAKAPLISDLIEDSAVFNDRALRTSDSDNSIISFMDPNVKYSLPPFTCNLYDNLLAITVNVKNVDPESIRHRTLDNDSGIHVLLTSIGAGFYPVCYSLCLKIHDHSVDPTSLTVEPWDNNVVFTLSLKNSNDIGSYSVGLNEEFMEQKDLPAATSLKKKFDELMVATEPETDRRIEVIAEGDDVVVNISPKHIDSDEEGETGDEHMKREHRKQHLTKSRSVSESSGDELPNSACSTRSKGILKSRRTHGLSRSVSESSFDDSAMLASSTDLHYDSVHDFNSESDCSSFKKTVRFNDVVSRQLYRSNSSILGQRKKNQRKLKNKKRAHERRVSESENSETEEKDKYKVNTKESSECSDGPETVKPILNRDKLSEHRKTASMEIDARKNSTNPIHKCKRSNKSKENDETLCDADKENTKDIVKTEFKNDLIFDLDM